MTPGNGVGSGHLRGAVPLMPKGRLAENVVHFVRVLRVAGLPVGPARALAALEAVEAVGLENRDDFRAALAAVRSSVTSTRTGPSAPRGPSKWRDVVT